MVYLSYRYKYYGRRVINGLKKMCEILLPNLIAYIIYLIIYTVALFKYTKADDDLATICLLYIYFFYYCFKCRSIVQQQCAGALRDFF